MTDLKKITTGYIISQHPKPCIGKDPQCPCQDGDACHYKDCGGTKALPVPVAQPEQEPVISAWSLREVYFDEDGEPSMHRSPPAAPEQEPTPWRDMVVVSLVREGIDKHKARELADHFAAQRPWVGLTDEELRFYRKKHSKLVNAGYDKVTDTNMVTEAFDSAGFYKEVLDALKERNNG